MMSVRHTDLHLFEEVILLALKDDRGTFYAKSYLPAVAGAMMAELLLTGRIEIEGKRKLVNLVDAQPLGDPLLDEVLVRIRDAKRRAALSTWIQRISSTSKLSRRALEGLCRKNILREDEQQILILFKQRVYPELDHGPEQRIIWKLQEAIFSPREDLEPRVVVLLALANAADLLAIPFERRELRERKTRIKRIINGDLIGEATKEAVEATQAAIAAAAIVPIIAAGAATSAAGS
jgi:hypothetical protein